MFIVKILYRKPTECSYFDYSVFENLIVRPFKSRKEANDYIVNEAVCWIERNTSAKEFLKRYTGETKLPKIAHEDIEELENILIRMEEEEIYSFIFEINEFDDSYIQLQ